MAAKILIIEDDDDLRYTLALLLEIEGFHPIEATNYGEAMAALSKGDIAAVITDIQLGRGPGGAEVAEAARLLPSPPRVIAFAGSDTAATGLRPDLFFSIIPKSNARDLLPVLQAALREPDKGGG